MNRSIILSEHDYNIICLKLCHASAVAELLLSDNANSEYPNNVIINCLAAISLAIEEASSLAGKARIAA